MNEPALVSHVNQREISIVQKFYNTVTRKKPVGYSGVFREDSYNANQRWMGTGRTLLDITTTGLSNTIGSPLYILTGFVIKTKAGPAIVISYLIASISSLCAALTYSELMNQISTHGSDYLYSYVTMGELYGFLVGWNLILEYCVDVASVSKALTIHIDKIYFEGEISTWQTKTAPFPGSSYFDANHVDLFSVAFCFILTLIIAMGGKFSKVVNNFFTCFNLVCYVSIMVFGSFSCNLSYWTMEKEGRNMTLPTVSPPPDPSPTLPPVGFMPRDFQGALRGAGSCIFAFAGFRAIFGDGVKSKDPKRNLPIASISTLIISTVLYIGVSFTISCMIPSWKIDTAAPIFSAFTEHNLLPLQKLLAIGAIAGLVQASIYKFLPLPPLLTMMSEDGLLFKFMGDVDKETGGPFKGTVTYGIVSTVFVAVLVIDELIDMLSIGTLIAYIMASVSIIRLRYKPINGDYLNGNSSISLFTERKVKVSLVIYTITVTVFGWLIAYQDPTTIPFITSASVLTLIMLICGTLIYLQPQNVQQLSFYCPCVPLMPLFSIFLNCVLMMHLSFKTWIRFAVWMGIGLIVYFVYSIRYSNLSDNSVETLGRHSGGYPNSDPPKRTHVRRVSRKGRLDGYHIDHTPLPSNRRSRSTPAKSARAGVRNQSREEQMAARLREWNEFLRAQNLNRQRAELSSDPEGSVCSQPRISYKTNSNGGV